MLARAGAIQRLRLSPEGFTFDHNRRLVQSLLADGLRVFTFSLHSPSAKPGCTPFVQTEADLRTLLDGCRRFCDFFLEEVRGVATTPAAVRDVLIEHGRWAGAAEPAPAGVRLPRPRRAGA